MRRAVSILQKKLDNETEHGVDNKGERWLFLLKRPWLARATVSTIMRGRCPGGVMGKMIDAQSIVVASTVTKRYGREGSILRFVFFHSLALAMLAGMLVYAQAYVSPLPDRRNASCGFPMPS
jgi:hypothetical protein